MTTVVATTTSAFVEVTEISGAFTLVEAPSATATVEIVTAGPQGPAGVELPVLAVSPVDGSLVYYDNTVGAFRADAAHTFLTTTDGGNF
jgi:hypothetical protein